MKVNSVTRQLRSLSDHRPGGPASLSSSSSSQGLVGGDPAHVGVDHPSLMKSGD